VSNFDFKDIVWWRCLFPIFNDCWIINFLRIWILSNVIYLGISYFHNSLEHCFSGNIKYLIDMIGLCLNEKFKWLKRLRWIVFIVCVIIPSNLKIIARHIWVWKIWYNNEPIFAQEFFELTQELRKHFKAVNECASWVTNYYAVYFFFCFKFLIKYVLAYKFKFIIQSYICQLDLSSFNHLLRNIKTNYFFCTFLG